MASPFEGTSFGTKKPGRTRHEDQGCLETGDINGSAQDSSQIPVGVLNYLKRERICLEDSQSKKAFVCQPCSRTFSTLDTAIKHTRESSHLENMQADRMRFILTHLPPTTKAHRAALNRTLESAVFGVLADPVEVARRQAFASRLMSALSQRIPNLQIIGFGSTWSGLAMPDSDVNLDVCRKDFNLEMASKSGVARDKTVQTVATDNEVVRDPGLDYLLSEIFAVLRESSCDSPPGAATTAGSAESDLDEDRSKDMPNVYGVTHTNSERFCVSFADGKDVHYQITTGNPQGADTSALVRTYLSLDQRALNLAILFRKISKLGHLDTALSGTSPSTLLPILVIFYLQHRYPTSLLPNLHQLYRDHKDELPEDCVYSAYWGRQDLSFVKDVEWIKKHWTPLSVHWPADGKEEQQQTTEDAEKVDLAELWLGLLRFYLFDFQIRRCIVNITELEPVLKSSDRCADFLMVADPFGPGYNLCRSVKIDEFKSIYYQFTAAYGYFGVPRLLSGRHLFTNVRTREGDRTNEEEIDQSGQIFSEQQNGANLPKPSLGLKKKVHFSVALDGSDEFASYLTKIRLSLARRFKAELSADCSVGENRSRGNAPSADDATESMRSDETRSLNSEKPPAMIQIDRMIPHVFSAVLYQLIHSKEVPSVVQKCLEIKRMFTHIPAGTPISLAKLSEFTTLFARTFWSKACSAFVNRGSHTFPWDEFINFTALAFDTSCKSIDWTSEATSMSSDQDAPTTSEVFDDDRPEFYNSSIVESVTEDDLSSPFLARGHMLVDKPNMPSSVLGLAAPDEPSTLLAHFSRRVPHCRACCKTIRRMNTCDVSFSAWRKLRSSNPAVPDGQIAALSECLIKLADFHDCSDQTANRKDIVDILQRLVSRQYPNISLHLFGSCANGFDLPSSNMDLCVSFLGDSLEWRKLWLECGRSSVIKKLETELHSNKGRLGIIQTYSILHAKFPILTVRFCNGFEVYISISDHLPLVITKMLKTYTLIDPRLRVLGIALKIVVKLCGLENTSTGEVSSYAFIIMLIHYLQQKNQLPVLQEIYDTPEKPTRLVSGWNAWYQDNLDVVNRLWKRPEKETALGDLWLGFFHYYLFEFNRDMHVVTIGQKKLLPRPAKMRGCLLAIGDPFNLDHNLAKYLPRKTLLRILRIFHAVLIHHTTFVPCDIPLNWWQYSLFSPSFLLTNGRRCPTSKEMCTICDTCRHRAARCPLIRGPMRSRPVDLLIGPLLDGKRRPNNILPVSRNTVFAQSSR